MEDLSEAFGDVTAGAYVLRGLRESGLLALTAVLARSNDWTPSRWSKRRKKEKCFKFKSNTIDFERSLGHPMQTVSPNGGEHFTASDPHSCAIQNSSPSITLMLQASTVDQI